MTLRMKRRGLLKLGLGASVLLAVAGGGLALLAKPGLDAQNRLSAEARTLMHAVALGLLDGSWPAEPAAREAALVRHLAVLERIISTMPGQVRRQLSQLLTLLGSAPARRALAGLSSGWGEASPAELQAALQAMRVSRLAARQQIYHALRELHCAAFYTEPAHWALVGYPGPRAIP